MRLNRRSNVAQLGEARISVVTATNCFSRCRFPQLRIVLAHAGGNISAGEALIVAQECENIFLEPSWVAIHTIQKWIKLIGAKRIMFGSDMLENCPVELAKFRNMGLSEEELGQCLHKTARDFFSLAIDD